MSVFLWHAKEKKSLITETTQSLLKLFLSIYDRIMPSKMIRGGWSSAPEREFILVKGWYVCLFRGHISIQVQQIRVSLGQPWSTESRWKQNLNGGRKTWMTLGISNVFDNLDSVLGLKQYFMLEGRQPQEISSLYKSSMLPCKDTPVRKPNRFICMPLRLARNKSKTTCNWRINNKKQNVSWGTFKTKGSLMESGNRKCQIFKSSFMFF